MLRPAKVTLYCLVSDQGEGPEAVSEYIVDLLVYAEAAGFYGEYDQPMLEELTDITTEWVKEDK